MGANLGNLPDDLMDDILVLLPVKSLLCFRCVCKRFCALIDSDTYVKHHLTLSTQNKSKRSRLIVFEGYSDSNFTGLFSYSLLNNIITEINNPLTNPNYIFEITLLGSCNGLLCLLYQSFEFLDDFIILWNPATRTHLKLPPVVTTTVDPDSDTLKIHGFGYDSVSDDYKLVMLHQVYSSEDFYVSGTYVYSLKSNCWKLINSPDYILNRPVRPDIFVCGAMHWKCFQSEFEDKYSTYTVAAFDFVKEEFTTLGMPADIAGDKDPLVNVSEFGGCLAVVCHYPGYDDDIELWVMKDYGVRESWTKQLTFSCLKNTIHVFPLSYSESGEEVLVMLTAETYERGIRRSSEKLAWYHLENKSIEFVDVGWISEPLNPVVCCESLVSLGENAEEDEKTDGGNEGAKEDELSLAKLVL